MPRDLRRGKEEGGLVRKVGMEQERRDLGSGRWAGWPGGSMSGDERVEFRKVFCHAFCR